MLEIHNIKDMQDLEIIQGFILDWPIQNSIECPLYYHVSFISYLYESFQLSPI